MDKSVTPTHNWGSTSYTFDWNNMDGITKMWVSKSVDRILAEHGIQADPENGIGTHGADGEAIIEVKVTFL